MKLWIKPVANGVKPLATGFCCNEIKFKNLQHLFDRWKIAFFHVSVKKSGISSS